MIKNVNTNTINSNEERRAFVENSFKDLRSSQWKGRVIVVNPKSNGLIDKASFCRLIPSFFVKILSWIGFCKNYTSKNETVIKKLYENFGENRIKIISKRNHISINKFQSLSKRDLVKLFSGLAAVRFKDMENLFKDIKKGLAIDGLEDRIKPIRSKAFVEDLNADEINLLMSILNPFENISEITLQENVEYDRNCITSGKGPKGLINTLMVLQKLKTHKDNLTYWTNIIGKLLANHEPVDGLMIPHKDGWFRVHATIHGGGAYKIFLKPLTSENKTFKKTILYRPTRPVPTATGWFNTIIDDMRQNIAFKGFKTTKKATSDMINKPSLGFVDRKDEKLNIIAYSLGGGHAQRDIVHFNENADKFAKVTLISSVGVPIDIADKFAKQTNKSIKIQYHFGHDDPVGLLGDAHIGDGINNLKKVRVYLYRPEQEKDIIGIEFFRTITKCTDLFRLLATALRDHHSRIWQDAEFEYISEPLYNQNAQKYLSRKDGQNEQWENKRITRSISDIIRAIANVISNPIIQGESLLYNM